jgi:hypothetical protein
MSSSSDDDAPLSSLSRSRSAKKRKTIIEDEEESEQEAEFESEVDEEVSEEEEEEYNEDSDDDGADKDDDDDAEGDEDEDDDDDSLDEPLVYFKTKKAKPKQKKKATPKKKAATKKKTTPTKKKKTPVKKSPTKKRKSTSSTDTSSTSASAALYAKAKKGQLITELLRRWWYAFTWPEPSCIPKTIPKNCDKLDGFPGVYVMTSGDDVGKIIDYRNHDTCPNFRNMAKKSTKELKDLLLSAIQKQREVLIENEGENTLVEKDLKKLEKWTKGVNETTAEKEAAKVLKAAGF